MAGNSSSAVMAQRTEAHDSLDDFPTPPWAVRALMLYLGRNLSVLSCREPAANRGQMVRVLREYFRSVDAFDVHDYGAGFPVQDFLFPYPIETVDWTITNPPFKLAEEFIARALATSRMGVAMLVRLQFLESEGRYVSLFKANPPSMILQFSERVVIHQGKVVDPNIPVPTWSPKEEAFLMRKPSTASAYCWLVWDRQIDAEADGARFYWISPSRAHLERPGDYPDVPAADLPDLPLLDREDSNVRS